MMNASSWGRRAAVGGILALLMTSCYYAKDAIVTNPCDEPAAVRLSSLPQPPTDSTQWNARLVIPPRAGRLVANAFTDAGDGNYSYTAEVTIDGQPSQILSIPHTSINPEPVVIPASLCS
jgi:hypothetical protein